MTERPAVSLRVEKVLATANDEAARLHHEYIGAEHVLLALVAHDGVATTVLQNLGVDLADVRSRIESAVSPGRARTPMDKRPYTSRTKHALELAASAARAMGHTHLGTEHLLLGLLDESRNIAARVLDSFGIRADTTRAEIARLLDPLPEP